MLLPTIYLDQHGLARIFSAAGIAALLAANTGCAAQAQPDRSPISPQPPIAAAGPPSPPPPEAPVPPGQPLRGGVMPKPIAEDGESSTMQAGVARFLTNPDGDVDGFLTSDGAQVRFPPHMGSQVTSAIRPGDSVRVVGRRDSAGNFNAQRILGERSGRELISQPSAPSASPMPRELRGVRLSRLSAQGQVAHVTTAPRGEPDGVILVDSTVIKLTPPVAQQFPALLKVGANVAAQGYGTRSKYGTALQVTAFGSPGHVKQIYDEAPPYP